MSANQVFAVTPADGVALPRAVQRFYIGTSGNLTLVCNNSAGTITFNAVPVGFFDLGSGWAAATQVQATGTTASNIVAVD